jgi:hypothetical protein
MKNKNVRFIKVKGRIVPIKTKGGVVDDRKGKKPVKYSMEQKNEFAKRKIVDRLNKRSKRAIELAAGFNKKSSEFFYEQSLKKESKAYRGKKLAGLGGLMIGSALGAFIGKSGTKRAVGASVGAIAGLITGGKLGPKPDKKLLMAARKDMRISNQRYKKYMELKYRGSSI